MAKVEGSITKAEGGYDDNLQGAGAGGHGGGLVVTGETEVKEGRRSEGRGRGRRGRAWRRSRVPPPREGRGGDSDGVSELREDSPLGTGGGRQGD